MQQNITQQNNAIRNNMDGPWFVILSEIRKTEKDKYITSLIRALQKKGPNELIHKTEIELQM